MNTPIRHLAVLTAALALAAPLRAQNPQPPPAPDSAQPVSQSQDEPITMQFPHTSAVEVLSFYEKLTGKHLIRDSNLAGPELSIMVAEPVPKKTAIGLLESSLLLNGYTLVPVDEQTVKVLGPSRPPRTEGLPLYLEESELPANGDKVVSFYKPLKFLSPAEATSILQGVVQFNAYGAIAGIPNTGAVVITDKTPVIRKALALLDLVDHEPSQIITEFIPLQRANADKVVETLGQMFGSGGGGGAPAQGQPQQGAAVSTGGETHLLSGKAQFIADKRTNRVLVVVRSENYKYLRELIAKLDQPVEANKPLIRPLNYISVADLFPVLSDMLRGKDDSATNSSAASPAARPTPQSQNQGSQGFGAAGGSSAGVANTPDKLGEAAAQNPPVSVSFGSTSIIGDSSGNTIIVFGPPESKSKAEQIINLLDQRPKQVYLAAVIGQLQLDEGMEYGASWFAKINTTGGTNNLIGAAVNGSIATALTNLVTTGITNAINSFPSALTGLTVYGAIAQGVSTYARALETTGKFRVLSRPVVYTSNNKKAVIFNGQNVPVPSQTQTTSLAGGTSLGNTIQANITYLPAVLKLEVIPLINADREVNLVIAQQNNRVGQYQNVGGVNAPTIETQELTTTVRVPSGSTIVLGGLIQDDKTIDERGIPFLSRIPVVGALAGGLNNKKRIRRELVVMIQPVVVDSNQEMMQASDKEGGKTDLGVRSKNLKEKLQPTPTPQRKKQWYQKMFEPRKLDSF